ncbi:hypothetical protein HUU51_05165, partial [Candidatus Gracilibacteria bacterium]|nr:hypothetical protein [Candidatus Gracilibacteria bacterium]
YDKLILIIKNLIDKGILVNEFSKLIKSDNKTFILNTDQSSIINLLNKEIILKKPQYLGDINKYLSELSIQINIFLSEGINSENLIMNKGTKIYGTNISITLDDNNPYNVFNAHPDHKNTGGYISYGVKTEDEWLKIYEKTFSLLKKVDTGIYSELNKIIKKIIPLGTSVGVHNSASYKEAIGHLYLGYTISSDMPEINNLEAIIHESSHNKLNLIMQFDEVVLNTKEEIYYSAIRPDARHIYGVFIGYHAFAPTMYIIMKAYYEGFFGENKYWLEKIVLYHIKTKFLQKVIKKYAKLTPLGEEISKEIDFVISNMDILLKKLNPGVDIISRAKDLQIKHFNEVNLNYPYLKY